MNILYGKFGKALKFDKNKWSMHGGDGAPIILLITLAWYNPTYKFYIVSRNDLNRINFDYDKYFPHGNVINIFDYSYTDKQDIETYFLHNSIDIDYGVFFLGPTGAVNFNNIFDNHRKPQKLIAMEQYQKYVSTISKLLNSHRNIKHVGLCEDPRYFPHRSKDLFNREDIVIGQYNAVKTMTAYTSYETNKLSTITCNCEYGPIETISLIGDDRYNDDYLYENKKLLLNIYCNKNSDTPYSELINVSDTAFDRAKILKTWVLDNFDNDDCKIYGHWPSDYYNTDQFIAKPMADLTDNLISTKYTLCVGIAKNWITSKFWKMLHFGILPFLHHTYDTQRLLPIDDFFRCKDHIDFKNKIEYLEQNEDEYKRYFYMCRKIASESVYNGKLVNDTIFSKLIDNYKADNENTLSIKYSLYNTNSTISDFFFL